MTKLKWHNEKRKVNELVPYEKNPRRISPEQLENLKKSLKKFNLVEIPAIDADNKVIAGHQRLMILKLLGRGEEEIDVRVPNRKLTQKEFEQYLLISNRVTGEWDLEKLRDFDIELLMNVGFDDSDLSDIWDQVLEVENDEFNIEKEIKKAKETEIKLGDMFALGRHKLLCSDSTNPNTVKTLFGKTRADVINVDVPYNIGLSYDSGIGGKQNYGGKTNDKKTDEDYRLFVKSIIGNGLSVAKEDCHAFIWCDEKYVGMLEELYKEAGLDQKRLCMWLKDNQNPTPQVAFNKVTEFCLYGTRGKPYLSDKVKNLNEVLNKEVTTGGRLIDDIMDLFNIWLVKRLAGNEYLHPTQKPPTLYEKSLRRCSKPGDVILDLCAGSGSLMVASEQLKRMAYLVEIEPIFCQLIINRYEQLTKTRVKKLN